MLEDGFDATDRPGKADIPEITDWSDRKSQGFSGGELFVYDDFLYRWHGSIDDAFQVQGRSGVVPDFLHQLPDLWLQAALDPANYPSGNPDPSATNLSSGESLYTDQPTQADRPETGAGIWQFGGSEWWPLSYSGTTTFEQLTLVVVAEMSATGNVYRFLGASNSGSNPFLQLRHNGSDAWYYDIRDGSGNYASPGISNVSPTAGEVFVLGGSYSYGSPRSATVELRGFGTSKSSTDTRSLPGGFDTNEQAIGRSQKTTPLQGSMHAAYWYRSYFTPTELATLVDGLADFFGANY